MLGAISVRDRGRNPTVRGFAPVSSPPSSSVESRFLTHIEAGTQHIVEAHGPHEAIRPGEECPLSETYCWETIDSEDPTTARYAAEAG
ncbi:hypothetical protein BRC86_11870 [Halobacteriales archaeon QS_3_64_16]|nr:MAG: hypothetical protein BRC86_11870 [Halobacteriales archaeon QS_3_64_16]